MHKVKILHFYILLKMIWKKNQVKNLSFFSVHDFQFFKKIFAFLCENQQTREMQNLVSWEKLKTGTYVFMHRFSRDEKTIHHKTIPKTEMCQEQIHWQKLDLRLERRSTTFCEAWLGRDWFSLTWMFVTFQERASIWLSPSAPVLLKWLSIPSASKLLWMDLENLEVKQVRFL